MILVSAQILRAEQLYISGHIGLREYVRLLNRLALDSRRKLETRDPFQRYQMPGIAKEGVTQEDVDYFQCIPLGTLNNLLYSSAIFKR